MGHALSTPFGALKHTSLWQIPIAYVTGHALSTPFGALKHLHKPPTETVGFGGMPSQRPSGH